MDPRETDRICERLGDLAASAVPANDRLPDASRWAAIAEKLDGRAHGRHPWWPAMAVASMVLVAVGGWMVARRPLAYRVQGCTGVDHGVECSASRGDIAFSDGTRAALDSGTRVRIEPLAFGRGAELFLADGRARVAVVHRARTRWSVTAGPFRVEVTGTEFSVDWSSQRETVEVAVIRGEVRVSGGALGPTVLRAGQSLTASAGRGAPAETHRPSHPPDGPPATAHAASPTASVVAAGAGGTGEAASPSRALRGGRSQGTLRSGGANKIATAAAEAVAPAAPNELSATPKAATRAEAAQTFAGPALDEQSRAADPTAARPVTMVVLGQDGRLSGAMTGMTWLTRGVGTNLSTPVTDEAFTRLLPDGNGLCVSGTVAGLRCVNENSPQARCNWDSNWGVAIGFDVNPRKDGWGSEAPKAIAVEFHGRSASYRLNAHRHADPRAKNYCVENYRSGQPVTPTMFKTRCWEDEGDGLSDFTDVDLFNLQFSSGMEYVAFHYCISAIRIQR